MKKYILFESLPDFCGSPKAIYDCLVSKGYDKKYDLVWAVDKNFVNTTKYKSVPFFGTSANTQKEILDNTILIIDSNRYIYKRNCNAFRLHTRHGNNLKRLPGYSNVIGEVDAMLCSSNFMKKIEQTIYPSYANARALPLGFPINDLLFVETDLYSSGFIKKITNTEHKFKKIILWCPTYRQNRTCPRASSKIVFKYGLPILDNIDSVKSLNEVLKKHDILLLYQIHHGQAYNYEALTDFSNIKSLKYDEMLAHNLDLQKISSAVDAVITDYSSIYFEFLLLNKPIALTIPDLIEYNHAFGFWFNYLDVIKGEYIITLSQLKSFIADIANNLDKHKNERQAACKLIYDFPDNHATDRVIDYLIAAVNL